MRSYSSKTTYNIRKEIHDNVESLDISELSKKYNISPPTTKIISHLLLSPKVSDLFILEPK